MRDTGIGIPPHRQQDDLRGVPAGRRHHQPQVRRHGPGPLDQPGDRRACWAARSGWPAAPGEGSTFTLYLPQSYVPAPLAAERARRGESGTRRGRPDRALAHRGRRAGSRARWRRAARCGAAEPAVERAETPTLTPGSRSTTTATTIEPDDRVLLIVEDDATSRGSCWTARASRASRGSSPRAASRCRPLARRFQPDAITLDIRLPDVDGWTVLDRLKHDPDTRHIPVHIISATRGAAARPEAGRHRLLQKPVDAEALDEALRRHQGLHRAQGAQAARGRGRRGRSATASWT